MIVGARNESFTGMDESKVFNIVFVKDNHGAGIGKTASPDVQLTYTGTQTSADMSGGRPVLSNAAPLPPDFKVKVAMVKIALPTTFSVRVKEITVYDCSGKLLKKVVTGKNCVDLRKDFNLSSKLYIVKARVIR